MRATAFMGVANLRTISLDIASHGAYLNLMLPATSRPVTNETPGRGESPLSKTTFAWGLDVAGNLDMVDSPSLRNNQTKPAGFVSAAPAGAAGGVGGLLATCYPGPSMDFVFFHAYDGSGNTMRLAHKESGGVPSSYSYGPYGETRTATENASGMGFINHYRFSTKFAETALAAVDGNLTLGNDAVDLYDYGFRWYHARLGRWTSRDPIGEAGGTNLFAFVGNGPVSRHDAHGLAHRSIHVTAAFQFMQFTMWQNARYNKVHMDGANMPIYLSHRWVKTVDRHSIRLEEFFFGAVGIKLVVNDAGDLGGPALVAPNIPTVNMHYSVTHAGSDAYLNQHDMKTMYADYVSFSHNSEYWFKEGERTCHLRYWVFDFTPKSTHRRPRAFYENPDTWINMIARSFASAYGGGTGLAAVVATQNVLASLSDRLVESINWPSPDTRHDGFPLRVRVELYATADWQLSRVSGLPESWYTGTYRSSLVTGSSLDSETEATVDFGFHGAGSAWYEEPRGLQNNMTWSIRQVNDFLPAFPHSSMPPQGSGDW